jgi:cytochrome oxidase assembly protein ShyY1
MKLITAFCALLMSMQALAHQDHALGDDHMAYHIALYALAAVVIFKGYAWLRAKKRNNKKD